MKKRLAFMEIFWYNYINLEFKKRFTKYLPQKGGKNGYKLYPKKWKFNCKN